MHKKGLQFAPVVEYWEAKFHSYHQRWTSSRKSVLSKPHFRNRSGYEFSKLSMHFFKLEPENLICLPLVSKLIKNQSANINATL